MALKVLPAHTLVNPTYLERFRREAKAAARLHHTNIVPVFGVGEADGVHFYAMQYIAGEGLDRVLHDLRRLRRHDPGGPTEPRPSAGSVCAGLAASLASGRFAAPPAAPAPPEATSSPSPAPHAEASTAALSTDTTGGGYHRSVARIGVQAAEALAYAHRQGVLHRDIKPSNLLLDAQGTVWVTDFGLAKAEGNEELTQTGDIVGTVRYMAPERFDGRSLPQSDVYSLGLPLYELLALRPAFDDSNRGRLIEKVLHEPPPPLRRLDPRVPRDLETIVLKCLAKEPAGRYATAEILAEDLRRFLADRPVKARRTPWHERTWRWCRRNPAVACLLAAVAVLVSRVAVISTVAAVRLGSELRRPESAEQAQTAAKQEALAKLWESHPAHARASRMTRQPGQRFDSLRAIQAALQLPLPEGRSLDELRTEAVAALSLCLPDLEVEREWQLDLTGATAFTIADTFDRYAFADRDGNVSVRRMEDHAELCRLPGEGPLDWYNTLYFSPDGRFLVQRSRTAAGWNTRLWRLDRAEPVVMLAGDLSDYDFNPDSRQCAVLDPQARELRIHDTETGRELRRFHWAERPGELRWNPRRPLLAGITAKGWRTIDVETGKVLAEAAVPGHGYNQLAWHPEGRLLAVTNQTTRQITVWDMQTRQPALPPLEGHRNGGIVLRFNHAGDLLLSTDWNATWHLWDARTGKQLLTQQAGIPTLCFRADDGLVGADVDANGGKVRLFRMRPGSEFRTVVHRPSAGKGGYYGGGTLDARGRLFAVYTREGVALVDVLRGEEAALLPLPGNFPLAFEAGDEAVWTSGGNGGLRWPFQTDPADPGKRRVGPPQPMSSIVSVNGWRGSPDLNLLAIPNLNRGALLWQRTANRTLALAPQEDVRNCAVSPDGRWVATGSHSHQAAVGAKVWDVQSGRPVADLPIAGGCSVGFSPDSRWLLTSSGRVRIWRTGLPERAPTRASPPRSPRRARSYNASDRGPRSAEWPSPQETAMRTRALICWLLLAVLALLVRAPAAHAGPAEPARLNFVILLIDDMGWRDLSCYGSTFYETPHTDRLAAQGLRCTNGYAACPVCSPTRASILTGKYPARLHLTDWLPGRADRPSQKLLRPAILQHLPLEEVTIAEALKPLGYASASIGKWHLGGPGYGPEQQGFDVNVAGCARGSPPSYFFPYRLPGLEEGRPGEYLTDRLTDEAERFLDRNKDRPFFLYFAHYAVHIPLQAKKDAVARYRAKAKPGEAQNNPIYAAMVESVDDSVGRILKKLDDLGVAGRTVVFFTSDNGGLSVKEGPNTPATSNTPLRAGKGYLYEGGIREPFLVRWPGVVKPGSVSDVPVCSIDLLPTILDVAGARLPAGHVPDGVSLVPLLKGTGAPERDALYWHYPHYSNQGGKPGGAVRHGDEKLIEFYEDGKLELYNLRADPGEKDDLAARMPERARELRRMLREWRSAVGAQMPTPNPDYRRPGG